MVARKRYGGSYGLANVLIPNKRARVAFTGARYAYNNRKQILGAGRVIARGMRKAYMKRRAAKRRARMQVGNRIGTSNSKKLDTVSLGVQAMAGNTFHYQELILPNEGQNIDQRERNLINLRGFKICMDFAARVGDNNDCLYMNLALVTNRKDTSSNVVSTSRWFRGNGDDREEDFDTVLLGIDRHCRPINTDEHTVFFHKRMKLGFAQTARYPKQCCVMKYVPIKRQIRFTAAGVPDTRFFLVWYASDSTSSGNTATANKFGCTWHHLTYFREPKDR